MLDNSADGTGLPPAVSAWLHPLGDGSVCGPDLEYAPEFLELTLATGKPATQFAAAEPPDWLRVREIAEELLSRTRDLRIALLWGRAMVNISGFAAVPAAVGLLHGLIDRFWEDVHPLHGDDPDALARLSVIGGLNNLDSLLGDVRNAALSADPRLADLRVRDVEVALGKLAPRANEPARTQAEIAGRLAGDAELAAALRDQASATLGLLGQLHALVTERFRPDLVVDLQTLRGMLTGLRSLLPEGQSVAQVESSEPQVASAGTHPAAGVHRIESRQEAIRAIDLVCAYLERNEPTNPAQLLLRRAAKVIDKNFLQLVGELAPDAIKEVARIMGVDPKTLSDQN
jgi:type VI secretion system protein ImpA